MFRNGARPKDKKTTRTKDGQENQTTDLINDLTKFEDFQREILPALQKDLKSGLTAKQLREKYTAYAQARLITEALMNPDANKAIPAAKDIIDRSEGKATERKVVKHQYEDLSDQELDAILESEEADLTNLEDRVQ